MVGILATLGIGVYTSDGVQLLAGSETGSEDVWVMAELLPGMAVSASRPGPTIEQYLATLETQLGTGLEPAELAATYAVMVETLPEFGMSRVIDALGIGFGPDQRLTRFEAWLLTVAWLPPNGSTTTSAAPWPLLAVATPLPWVQVRCGPTGKGGKKAEYSLYDQYGKPVVDGAEGVVVERAIERLGEGWAKTGAAASNVSKGLDWLKGVAKPITFMIDIIKAAQVALNFDVAVDAEPISTHEVHDTKGETKEKKRVQITTTAKFLGASVAKPEDCKYAGLLGLPDPNTPIEGAQVAVMLDGALAKHGTVRRRSGENVQRASADDKGQVIVWYEPNYERPESAQNLGDAFLHKVQGKFTVSVNVTAAMGQLFNVFSGWEFVLDLMGLNEIEAEITVGWHDPAAKVAITEALEGWNGSKAIYLETCDGITWTGAVVANGTLEADGGKLTQIVDSDIEVIVAAGSSTGTSPILIDTDVAGTVEGGTVENLMTQTGVLTLSIDENGTATIEMVLEEGTQDITVTAQGMTIHRLDKVKPGSYSWTTPLEPAQCEGK